MENCFHCGDPCRSDAILQHDKYFCCHGCKTVFEILNDNDLSYYYDLEHSPGNTPLQIEGKFEFLENETIVESLLEFNEQNTQIVSLLIPSIHCSSCIWVLEHLKKLNPAVKASQVNFPKKTVRITYSSEDISLKTLVLLLSKLGYEPYISLDDATKKKPKTDRSLIYKLGVAGFAFGNIMFLSFPEYFEVNEFWLDRYKYVFRWLTFAFAIPVMVYSARDYLISASKGLASKLLNIDVPIAIGILVLFIRSTLEIIMDWGSGFFDSMTGLVFFLLLGKFFQQKTYAFLSFERDYKSYFPIAVTTLVKNKTTITSQKKPVKTEQQTQVYDLKKGDRLLIRNSELIPVDSIVIKGNALIDYSFVTGEAVPVLKQSGDKVFAGGKQKSGVIELEVLKPVEQSYLTQLWSNAIFDKKRTSIVESLTNKISKRFTISLLTIAVLASAFWLYYDISKVLNVFTAVLIIACPCAIALAAPFTLGNMLRIFGNHNYYIKDASVIEQLSHIDTIVFDKTGTLTTTEKSTITYEGLPLTQRDTILLTNTLRASNHPLSRTLYNTLLNNEIKTLDQFSETIGKGISGRLDKDQIRIGAHNFVIKETTNKPVITSSHERTSIHISINKTYKGCYIINNAYRTDVKALFNALKPHYKMVILSGDNAGERNYLKSILPENTALLFNQKPQDKLNYIKQLQNNGQNVLMIGDGLNDAGALAQSNIGLSISENVNVFSPACDGILDATRFKDIVTFLSLSKQAMRTIKQAFVFSLFYNFIGLAFAITGHLSPVVAAILMPLSSISIVAFTTVATYVLGKKLNTKN